ncbi:MAG TPA: amino acid racemase [Candidatus Ruthenibacterium avium]|uniref:Amino acid racemase n=1 Tax=Candidatus Ruthenibacterium avium TaxID=2838751 RepID=A0A9D2M381_9FIRM|nr:amino acid racemase [Candidatus Ruthenibacterium avium]
MPQTLGILGGLGPMATVYFYDMLVRHTKATCDQDHLDVIINSRASTPDRTSYILGQSTENPFDIMARDAQRLVTFGADVLAIPCNTAHYFYDRLNETISVPILNMVEETVLEAKARGCCRVGILATSGTVQTGTYSRMCERHGLEFVCPDESHQQDLMNVIYGDIKQGKRPDMARFFAVADSLKRQGCTRMILGCTELSIIKKDEQLDAFYIDSMSVLAKNAITTFGRTPIGFEKE